MSLKRRQRRLNSIHNDPEKAAEPEVLSTTQQEAIPTPSPSTDGSISGYIGKTLKVLADPEVDPKVSFLPPTPTALEAKQEERTLKES